MTLTGAYLHTRTLSSKTIKHAPIHKDILFTINVPKWHTYNNSYDDIFVNVLLITDIIALCIILFLSAVAWPSPGVTFLMECAHICHTYIKLL